MSRRKTAAPTTMWEEAEEVPRAGIPSTERLNRRARWARRLLWAGVFLFPLVCFAAVVAFANGSSGRGSGSAVVQVDPGARAAAITTVTDWLVSVPAPLPGGTIVSWDSARGLPSAAPDKSNPKAVTATLTVHSLTVRDGSGSMYTVEVLVAVDDLGEVAVVGTPSLLPVAPSSDWASSLVVWPGTQTTTATDSVKSAVGAWVESFTSGDPARLRLTVGDPDSNHAYVPLGGLLGADHTVGAAAWLVDVDGKPTSRMLVQVEVRFKWPRVGAPSDKGPRVATYDLLVEGANSAAPRVVAWGGVGTGPVLVEYGNAVVGRQLVAAPTATAAATPAATAGVS